MAYSANQYNYATPLSSTNLVSEQSAAVDKEYFILGSNTLDGAYSPISGDVGLWGNVLSGDDGTLATPFVVTVTESTVVHTFRLTSSVYAYPIAFTVKFYNGTSLLHTITETDNHRSVYTNNLHKSLSISHYEVSITKLSAGNTVARLYNLYNPMHIKRNENVPLRFTDASELLKSDVYTLSRRDSIHIAAQEKRSSIINTINKTYDTLKLTCSGAGKLTNVHTRMKEPSRHIYGKVYITYTDPMLDSATLVSTSDTAYNSNPRQVLDNATSISELFFNLYKNDLSGRYVLSDANSQIGWTSKVISNAAGDFDGVAPYLRIDFAARPVSNLRIIFDDSNGAIPVDFTVEYRLANGTTKTYAYNGNTLPTVKIEELVSNVVAVIITVTKLSKSGYPVVIVGVPIMSTLEYVGYQDRSNLISIDLLEELTYDDDIEALGGVSANVITVALDNSEKDFYFNNVDSVVASSLKRNRKIIPWLGVEVADGEIEWHTLGTFWSYRWDVPVESLVAKVVGFDTIGLLDKTSFSAHTMQVNKSIGQLIEYVLDDAKQQLNFISYKIDPALYDILIPYAWFDNGSHTAALRKISKCYPMHIYCDREGNICAAPQKLRLDYYYDTWSGDTNVISKNYSSLHTTLPNIITIEVKNPITQSNQQLASDDLVFNVNTINSRTLNFSKPYVSGIVVTVDCDSTVSYTYSVYSWGIVFNFTGTGNVRAIECTGTVLDISHSAVLDRRDEESIHINGAIKREIKSDFIQTADLASMLIERIVTLSEYDKYDADVEYRGDIALSINDPILLVDGIAPDSRYNIKRHELFWDGSLIGSAHLNT